MKYFYNIINVLSFFDQFNASLLKIINAFHKQILLTPIFKFSPIQHFLCMFLCTYTV